MNVSNGNVSFRIELESIASFYFCEHFYRAFKENFFLRNSHVVRQFKLKEECCFYSDGFVKKIKQCLINRSNLPEKSSFKEIRKLLIQYFPTVKNNFLADYTIIRYGDD